MAPQYKAPTLSDMAYNQAMSTNNPIALSNQTRAATGLANTTTPATTSQGYGVSTYQPAVNNVQNSTLGTMASPTSITNGTGADRYYDTMSKIAEKADARLDAHYDSPIGKAEPYIKGAAGVASTVASLANIYLGFQQVGIMKDQLKMAKEQWAEQKQELAHVRGVRKRLNASYMA